MKLEAQHGSSHLACDQYHGQSQLKNPLTLWWKETLGKGLEYSDDTLVGPAVAYTVLIMACHLLDFFPFLFCLFWFLLGKSYVLWL